MSDALACRVCGAPTEPLYRSASNFAVTSSAVPVSAPTTVDLCAACGHAQTRPAASLETYYASEYRFRAASDEEDDLYARDGERNVYRSEHQQAIVERSVDTSRPLRVLDFGCGKARTLKLLASAHPAIEPYVYDVSDSYRRYWDEFVPAAQQASFDVPDAWRGAMDAVLSFFALEHVECPHEFVALLRTLLAPGGSLLLILPNVYTNASDLVVADHVNHFSQTSLRRIFAEAGFANTRIDTTSFSGAYVVEATRIDESDGVTATDEQTLTQQLAQARELGAFWSGLAGRVRAAEAGRNGTGRSAIYGSGVYGLLIAAALQKRERVSAFLDQNAFRQGQTFLDIPVVPPDAIDDDVDLVYVGLNPLRARSIVANVSALGRVPRELFFP